jgi:glycosyltransferase involved in cell wall biosynthesis
MLSINIPVYNYKVKDLVDQLTKQAISLSIDYEIRIYDDNSVESVKQNNRELIYLNNVIYREMEKNLGRSAIRNKMGLESKYRWLLFIDADSELIYEDYLKTYINKAEQGYVLCGGTAYNHPKPENPKKLLRWVYGKKREVIPAAERNRKKNFIITSNNFLIDKEVFEIIHFSENIGPYGHEDTLLGYELYSSGIKIVHIDNPVEHAGLEDSEAFLSKSREALKNLKFISEEIVDNKTEFSQQITFLNHYKKITLLIPHFLLRCLFYLFKKCIERNLTGKNPSIKLFDVYKLCYFSTLKISV